MAFIPQRDAGEFEWLCFEQSGVLTTPQAVRLVGRGVVRSHLRLGRWRRICRGILLTHNGDVNHDQQLWVAVLAAGPGALLAGAAAAAEGGVRHLRVPMLHVLIPAARGSTERISGLPMDMPAVRVHRSRILPPEHQQRRVTPEEVRDVLAVLPSVRRRSLIRTTLADIDGGAHALSEIDFARLCRRFHLPPPDRQERRKDASGRNRYLDAYWREWHLHVEVDGSHHMDVRHWAADMLRQNEVWIAGDRILRFPAWLIRAEPAQVADQLLVALRAAGWR